MENRYSDQSFRKGLTQRDLLKSLGDENGK